MQQRRVAITGLGVISPVGNTPDIFFANLMAGRSGVRRRQRVGDYAGLDTRIAAEADFDATAHLPRQRITVLDRYAQMGLVAANAAIADAGLAEASYDKARIGVYWGSGMGGAETIAASTCAIYRDDAERVNPFTVIRVMSNAAGSAIALDHGLQGPCLTYSNACASSAISIGEAYRAIRHGQLDAVVAGGSEALLTRPVIKAWESLQTLAEEDAGDCSRSCRPFSKGRSGFVLGEGAASVVLEDMEQAVARGARIYGELVAYGASCDASHITKPDASGQAASMRLALREAGIGPESVQYINAHGTATAVGDVVETQAIKTVFGTHAKSLAVSSTKSMHGHVMGATGAIEFLATVLTVHQQAIPPTANWIEADPDCDLDWVPNIGRHDQPVRYAMTNSFAFGGSNASLIVRGVESAAQPTP